MSKHRASELGVSLARVRNDTMVCGTRAERVSREVLEAGLRDVMTALWGPQWPRPFGYLPQ